MLPSSPPRLPPPLPSPVLLYPLSFLPPLRCTKAGANLSPSPSIHFIPHLHSVSAQPPLLLHLISFPVPPPPPRSLSPCYLIPFSFSPPLKCLLLIHQAAAGVRSHSFLTVSKVSLGGGGSGGSGAGSVYSTRYQPVINYSPTPHLFSVCREK